MKTLVRVLICIFLIPIFLTSCWKKKASEYTEDFNQLMGFEKNASQFIQTVEDHKNYNFYKKVYDENKKYLRECSEQVLIPKIVHFIWVGPHPFPEDSITNITSWVDQHPDWTFKFWTDRLRPAPHAKMEVILINETHFLDLYDLYLGSENFAEQSDLLRYEILLHEGGVYVDHDVYCYRPFDCFHDNLDFYCGVEPLHEPLLSTSVSVCNNIIGSRPDHPILKICHQVVREHWHCIGNAFPGNDVESIVYRIGYRSFAAFDSSVKLGMKQGNFRNIVLPSGFLNKLDGDYGYYAHHFYASTWFDTENKYQKQVRQKVYKVLRRTNKLIYFTGISLFLNIVLVIWFFLRLRNIYKTNDG